MNFLQPDQQFSHGTVTYREGAHFGPRRQTGLQLIYIFKGSATILIDGTPRRLDRGEAALLLPDHQESYTFSATEPTSHGWCSMLFPHLSPALLDTLESLEFNQSFSQPMRQFDRMIRGLKKKNNPLCTPLICSLIRSMLHQFFYEAGINQQPEQQPLHPAVERARKYIKTHLDKALDLTQIASHSGITPAHLNRLFKEQKGETTIAYLWRQRAESAAKLLAETGLSAAEIAYQTGFSTPAHFSRLFKELYNIPPGQYRKNIWNK